MTAAPLAESEEAVFARFSALVDLAGARVVEIGGAVPDTLLASHGVRAWCGVDPRHGTRAHDRQWRIRGVAERLPLRDGCADAVFSCNALQFVDVPGTLAEARRVLRPGGILYSHFGPIWSAPDGHQLEYVSHRGRDLLFWRDTLLPPYAHLRYGPDTLREILGSALTPDLVELLVHHVHESATVNRLFFEDYVRHALESGLEWLEVSASSHLDYEIRTPEYRHPLLTPVEPAALVSEVSRRCGGPRQLGIRDVRMVLRRPPDG
jgi:SAM-dependent methyltransferase